LPDTRLSIDGELFSINGAFTYSELAGSHPDAHGLLMNARFIQGVFDDTADRDRYARWGRGAFDPEAHTDELIAALPDWYAHGLRALTVGFQGGGPCFTIDRPSMCVNPFGEDGETLDSAYAGRMDRLIRAAGALGMAVIVSYFYGAQARRLRDGRAVRNAVTAASEFLGDGGYTNVIIEVANEHNIGEFQRHPIIHTAEGMAALIDLSRDASGGLPVGCSGGGGYTNREVAEASDVILIHGNGCTRQRLYNMIQEVRGWDLDRPIVFNEDSQAIGQLGVTYPARVSWGYYNNMTKQEPPTDWRILPGEDAFFARRMAEGIGIDLPPLPSEEQFHLHGLEPHKEWGGMRWLRLASLYPETVDHVDYYRNGSPYYTGWDEPFSTHYRSNWAQGPVHVRPDDREWKAVVHLRNGEVVEKVANV
jgi:hypothetical protein